MTLEISDATSEQVFIDVTPEMAAGFLLKFGPNRTSSNLVIDKYARMMAGGQWMRVGEPVAVTDVGEFINGAHRLKAIVKSGCTIALPFQFHVAPDARKVIDTGNPREYKHFLQIEGIPNGRILAPLARRMFFWDQGVFFMAGGRNRLAVAGAELDEYLHEHPELHEVAAIANGSLPPNVKPTALGVCVTVFRRINKEAATDFCTAWTDGASLEAGHPVLALRDRLARDASTRKGSAEEKIALACAAWNAWREGRSLSRMQLPTGFGNDRYPHPR